MMANNIEVCIRDCTLVHLCRLPHQKSAHQFLIHSRKMQDQQSHFLDHKFQISVPHNN